MNEQPRGFLACVQGIDGSGKSAVSRGLQASLQARKIPALLLDRHKSSGCSPFAAERLDALAEMLWRYPSDTSIRSLGDRHLIHLMAAWFHAFGECVLRSNLAQPQVVILDTWFHKYVARFSLKQEFQFDEVDALFRDIITPDLVVLLTLDPWVAWQRKITVRPTETADTTCAADSPLGRGGLFVIFQNRVQQILRRVGVEYGWREIDSGQSLDKVIGTATQMLLDVLPSSFVRSAGR